MELLSHRQMQMRAWVLPVRVLALTTSAPLAGSMTGVEVTPTKGLMLPHGKEAAGTGFPSFFCHTTCSAHVAWSRWQPNARC
jgi:hypothetical protein